MQLIAVLIAAYNPLEKKVIMLTRYYESNSVGIFYRNTVKDSMKFVCREYWIRQRNQTFISA